MPWTCLGMQPDFSKAGKLPEKARVSFICLQEKRSSLLPEIKMLLTI